MSRAYPEIFHLGVWLLQVELDGFVVGRGGIVANRREISCRLDWTFLWFIMILLWFLCYLATLSEKCPKQVTCTRTVNVQRYCCELLWGSMRDVIAILHATNHADRSGTKSCKSTVHVGTRCHGQEPPSFALCRSNAAMPLGQSFWVILLPLERHPENSAGLRSLTNVHCTFECWPPWFCSQMFFSILFIVFFLVFSLFVIMHCHPTSSINIQSACQPVHLQPLILYHWTKSLQVLLLALPSPWPYDYSL